MTIERKAALSLYVADGGVSKQSSRSSMDCSMFCRLSIHFAHQILQIACTSFRRHLLMRIPRSILPGYLGRLFTRISDNLELQLRDLHIRFQELGTWL